MTKYIYPSSVGATDSSGLDKNNCVVRALSNSSGKSYDECSLICKQWGRKHGKGCDVRWMPSMFREQGYTCLILGSSISAEYVKFYNPWCSDTQKSYTIKTLLQTPRYSKGNHVFIIRGHSFAVINGKLIDSHVNLVNSRVFMIFSKI